MKAKQKTLSDYERARRYTNRVVNSDYMTGLESTRAHDGYVAGLRAGRKERKNR